VFESGPDGFYTLVTLKVSKNSESEYYYINDDFYHNGALIDLQELIELNPNVSGVNVEYDYYFQTCRLKKCFINICY
jgi:hypothetical protein